MTWTSPDHDENRGRMDIDLDRLLYDPEYRDEVKSALARSDAYPAYGAGLSTD